jgi:SulP family sulfate permease
MNKTNWRALFSTFQLSFRPRLVDSLNGYNKQRLLTDVVSGITVGIVALPLAMAFAIASGLKPEAGIFTAIIAGFLISALGGSPVQIGGPAGAFIVVVYEIVEKFGVANLLIATIMAGLLLLLMGALRMGNLIRLIPISIVIGFTNGIAVLIALSQIKDFFGLAIPSLPSEFFGKVATIARFLFTTNIQALCLSLSCLAALMLWPRIFNGSARLGFPRLLSSVPGSVVVLMIGSVAAYLLGLEVETIGSKFGGVPQTLPTFAPPELTWATMKQLVAPALTIALLGAIESLLCARVADGMINDRHDPNQELMAQGIANVVTPFFAGMPATGTIARTVINIRSGGTSPVAGMVHAVTLLILIMVAAPLAKHIPLAVMSAILMFVAYNMGEWREFPNLRKFSVIYRTVMVTTFLLTVILDLTVAVEVGLVLAALFFIYRVSSLTDFIPVPLPEEDKQRGIVAFHVYGSLFFAAVGKLENLFLPGQPLPKVVIMEMHQAISIDTTGMDSLETLHSQLQQKGSELVLCALNKQPASLLRRSGFRDKLGPQRVYVDISDALDYARKQTAPPTNLEANNAS